MFAGHVMTGGIVSMAITENVHWPTLRYASDDVYVMSRLPGNESVTLKDSLIATSKYCRKQSQSKFH
jgi:hypothetical protein